MTPRQLLRTVHWYLRELTGEAEYDRYRARHLRHRPQAPEPTRREYERIRTRRQEETPQARCC